MNDQKVFTSFPLNKTKRLHIEMTSGVAGDMMVAGLLTCFKNLAKAEEAMLKALKSLELPEEIKMEKKWVMKNGVKGLYIKFDTPVDDWVRHSHDHTHSHDQPHTHNNTHNHKHTHANDHTHNEIHSNLHRNFSDIKKIIKNSSLTSEVKKNAIATFTLLAKAEGAVHDQPPEKVHFHEVGSLDAILEIVGACFLVQLAREELGITEVTATPLVLGNGYVRCAHGKMPVPVPAVSLIISTSKALFRNIGFQTGELTTPTGAALVLSLATQTTNNSTEPLRANSIGCGAGLKNIAGLTNILRIWVLESHPKEEHAQKQNSIPTNAELSISGYDSDDVLELTTWIDDSSGEELARAMEDLYTGGALEVAFTPITMKKSRPGISLQVLCRMENYSTIAKTLTTSTGCIGFRTRVASRLILPRTIKTIIVKGYEIAVKISTLASGEKKLKVEDASLRVLQLAVKNGKLSFQEVKNMVEHVEQLKNL